MNVIEVHATSLKDTMQQMQRVLGGEIKERWGEYTFTVNNENATGNIRFVTFEWGVGLLEYDIIFHQDTVLVTDTTEYNPIHFIYCLEGSCSHRFGKNGKNDMKQLERFQSVIITNKEGGQNYSYFPKGIKLVINIVQLTRKKYLKKRLNGVESLNKKLHEVFMDTDHENRFSYFGSYNLKLANKITALRKIPAKNGMIRIMQMEGMVYEILAMHITQHEKDSKNTLPRTSLLKRELKIVRNLARTIVSDFSINYSVEGLSQESGLSQAKLQEGFKLLYARTVTEYIRHIRLEAARDFINTTDMNISQVVYTIGFSSRSYFSKIFKAKYGISPSEFQHNVRGRGISIDIA
ncbi:helix-turn-helix domain-containing protein [Maribacter sp. ACAM166]|uniref:helix-turn-helix domain-containing protein n=1 Tax=Maribacter sp. ACAM166 TaxID=2508996 RepID=UPI0010FD3D16|nr:response regulator transcription factor [Maribacter sp. ACAM166]TLP75719.1 helix-turn-helix domain-containing protein [Maribacter sp. ACAM166]